MKKTNDRVMVVRISTGKSVTGLINYNENKVEKGVARLLTAQNMILGKQAQDLTYAMKVGTFERIIDGKTSYRLDKTTFHISLNFDPTEKLKDDTLKEIAGKYMEGIGYGNQPYLVYRHEDTHHPHIHIVSIKIDRAGKKVNDSFYKRRSEKVRKALEVEYNLVKATEKLSHSMDDLSPLPSKALEYSKAETKKAISHMVGSIQAHYKLTNLKEFQAVLSQYNIKAAYIRGTSKKGEYEGLLYSIADSKGERMGVGIKASSIYNKPTLPNLKIGFEQNKQAKKLLLEKTVDVIEKVLNSHISLTREDFINQLSKQGIVCQLHQGKNNTQQIRFIDNVHKVVCRGGELGKAYTWQNLEQRFGFCTIPKGEEGVDITNKIAATNNLLPDDENKELLKKAALTVISIYRNLRKDNMGEAYFESTFIKKLNEVDLVGPLLRKLPQLNWDQANYIQEKFKEYKRSKLSQIENKEKVSFKKHVKTAFQYIGRTQNLSPVDKLVFLYTCHLQLNSQDGKMIIHHTKADHLKLACKEDKIKNLLGYQETFPCVNTDKIKPYTKAEKAIISRFASATSQQPLSQESSLNHKGNNITSKVTLADAVSISSNESGIESNTMSDKKKRQKFKIS